MHQSSPRQIARGIRYGESYRLHREEQSLIPRQLTFPHPGSGSSSVKNSSPTEYVKNQYHIVSVVTKDEMLVLEIISKLLADKLSYRTKLVGPSIICGSSGNPSMPTTSVARET